MVKIKAPTKAKAAPVPLPVVQEPFYDITRDGITQSLLGLIGSCPEKARLRIIEGLVPASKGGGALAFGDIFHRALDGVYGLCKMVKDERNAVLTPAPSNYGEAVTIVCDRLYKDDRAKLKFATPDKVQDFETEFGMASVMLQAYFDRWVTDLADLSWVDIERVFEASYEHETPHDPGFCAAVQIPVRGKYDGVFRDRKKALWLFETKTKGQIDSDTIGDKLSFDIQVMLYLWSMKQTYGEWPRGVIYNVVRRPQLRQKQSEDLSTFLARIRDDVVARPEFYFLRYTVSITPKEIQEWAATDLVSMVRQAWAWSQGELRHRQSGNCQMWNRPCEYLQVCRGGDSSYLQRRDVVFPELQAVAEEE